MKLCPFCDTAYPNHHTTCEKDGARLIESRELEPGTVILGKYRIVRALGRGGMGTVYLADHIMLGRKRALKFISSELSHDPKILKRFRLEALATIELRHPNVVEVFDLDQAEDGSPYIAMEYVDGWGLREALADGPLHVERALDIARGIALGLGQAHAKNIIHRDVKPENILLARGSGKPEIPKVLDFGIAAMKETSTAVSQTRGLMLTPEYAAPEQWRGMVAEDLDGRVDLYALGGVLYEMLTGRTCFHAQNMEGWMYQHLHAQPAAPSELRPELVQWNGLNALVQRLLAKDREERPANVTEFLRELDGVRTRRFVTRAETQLEFNVRLQRKTVVATQSGVVAGEQSGNKSSSLRWTMIAGVCVVVFVLAGLGLKMLVAKQEKPAFSAGALLENSRDGLNYAWIPAGSFEMGCSAGDMACGDDEKPPHPVSISKGFWMGQTPVTVRAWKRYRTATNTPALVDRDGLGRENLNESGPEDMPVVLETWQQAASYCQWAGMKLPTEAQWEYAARAGTRGSRYGDLDAIAWYGNNSGRDVIDVTNWKGSTEAERAKYEQQLKDNGNFAHPVGHKQANAWHLYDMLGNVFEWTADWYGPTYYQAASGQDPTGPQTGETKIIRGGSWANKPTDVRVSFRTAIAPELPAPAVGFRCVGDF